MVLPVGDEEKAAVESITGPNGAGLQMRLHTNPTPPPPGSPGSAVISPSEAEFKTRDLVGSMLFRVQPGSEITLQAPVVDWTLTPKSPATSQVTGWSLLSRVSGQDVVLCSANFKAPLGLTPDSPTIGLQPVLSFIPTVDPEGKIVMATGGSAPPRKRGRMRRLAFKGIRRGQVERLQRTLESIGFWDAREGTKAEQSGTDAIYFVKDALVQDACEILIQRVNEALAETR